MARRLTERLVALAILIALAAIVWGTWTLTSPSRPKPGEGDEWDDREVSRRAGVAAEAEIRSRPGSPEYAAMEYARELRSFEERRPR